MRVREHQVDPSIQGSAAIVYITSNRISRGLGSERRRVSTYTVVMVLITMVVGVYIFLELNFIIGFLIVMLGAFIYYTRKRLEGAS